MAETILTDGKRPEWDYVACWPTGKPVTYPPLFQYYLAYSFKAVGIGGLDLFHWCIYANVVPFLLCIVLMVAIGAFLTNDYGGLTAALLFSTIPAVTMRTEIGFTDTDTFVLLFSLLTIFLFVLTVKKVKYRLISAFFCGFSLFLFSQTWTGYWYMLPLLCAGFFVWILQKREITRVESFAAFLLGFTMVFAFYESAYWEGLLLFSIFVFFEIGVQWGSGRLYYIVAAVFMGGSAWIIYSLDVVSPLFHLLPAALDTGDVLSASITQMIVDNFSMTPRLAWELLGPCLVLAFLGVYFVLKKREWWLFTFLVLYLLGTSLMLLRGGRFSLLLAIPLCLGTALFMVEFTTILQKRFKEGKTLAIVIIVIIVCFQVVQSEKVNGGPEFMTDDLWNAFTWIDSHTPADSVVIGHWGMGFFIESVARRRSVMDGSQYDLFWRMVKFGTMLTTDREEIAAKQVYGFDTQSEVEGLRTFSSDPEVALEQMEAEMTPFAEKDAYVIVDEYTVLTLGWWSQYGNWNYAAQSGRQYDYNVAFLASGRRLGETIEYKYTGGHDLIFLYRLEDEFHSFVPYGGRITPAKGTIFFKSGKKYFLTREEGEYGIIYLPYSEEEHQGKDVMFQYMSTYILGIPVRLENVLLTDLYFLDGGGLHFFELVQQYGQVKIYKVHKTRQENLNTGVETEQDDFTLAAVPT
jgi:hypothetical protein